MPSSNVLNSSDEILERAKQLPWDRTVFASEYEKRLSRLCPHDSASITGSDEIFERIGSRLVQLHNVGTASSLREACAILSQLRELSESYTKEFQSALTNFQKEYGKAVVIQELVLYPNGLAGIVEIDQRTVPVFEGKIITQVEGKQIHSTYAVEVESNFKLRAEFELEDGSIGVARQGRFFDLKKLIGFRVAQVCAIELFGDTLTGIVDCYIDEQTSLRLPIIAGVLLTEIDGITFELDDDCTEDNFIRNGRLHAKVVLKDGRHVPVIEGKLFDRIDGRLIFDCHLFQRYEEQIYGLFYFKQPPAVVWQKDAAYWNDATVVLAGKSVEQYGIHTISPCLQEGIPEETIPPSFKVKVRIEGDDETRLLTTCGPAIINQIDGTPLRFTDRLRVVDGKLQGSVVPLLGDDRRLEVVDSKIVGVADA